MRDLVLGALPELRIHPVAKWVRASWGDEVLVSSTAAILVWEPRRVVPSYAVPRGDVAAELVPWQPDAPIAEAAVPFDGAGRRVLDPRTPFTAHSIPGTAYSLRTAAGDLPGAAFAPDDADLAGHVVLDWNAFTRWWEEDDPVMGHPHDPFDRIDCLHSSRHVTIGSGGHLLADSTRSVMLFETPLPTRFYLPREDVAMDRLERSDRHTVCAYKGRASYWSARAGDRLLPDLAWTYEEPLHDALPVRGLVAFFTERLDLTVDGVLLPRPVTPWSEEPAG